MNNSKIKICRKIEKILLEITVISGFMTLLVGSNIDLDQLFRTIGLISITLSIIVELVKDVEIDHFQKEWVTE